MLRRPEPAVIHRRYAGPLVHIYLEDFNNLKYGYPEEEGFRRIVWRDRWWLVRGICDPESRRLYFSWRKPVIRVKARSIRA